MGDAPTTAARRGAATLEERRLRALLPVSERPSPRPVTDPAQLSFGVLEGASFLTVESHGADDAILVTTVREPPVCGEWSYDDSELEDSRFVAERIDGEAPPTVAAVPVGPIRSGVDAAPARPDAPPPPEGPRGGDPSGPEPAPTDAPAALAMPAPTLAPRPTPESMRRAHEATPGDTAAALAWAAHLERRGDARDALAVLAAAEAGGADRGAVRCAMAGVLGALQRYAEAEAALREAVTLRAPASEVAIQTGVLACRRARWRDAVGPLRTGVAGDPLAVTGRYFLGEALNQTDDLRGALEAYEAALAIDPAHWRALKGMGKVLDRLGRNREASEYHRRAREAQAR